MNSTNNGQRKSAARKAWLGLLLAAAMASGCASRTDTGAGRHASVGEQISTAPQLAADLAMPSPGKAKIVFVRTNKNAGSIDLAVHDGELMIGRSARGTYFIYECDPGRHVFSSSFGNVGILNADLLPDRIYYADVELMVRNWGPAWVKLSAVHPGSDEINWADLPRVLTEAEKTTVTSKQVEHDKTGIKRYLERVKKYQDEATPGYFNKILPEFGQTTPLISR